jgi:hypothetical protein
VSACDSFFAFSALPFEAAAALPSSSRSALASAQSAAAADLLDALLLAQGRYAAMWALQQSGS